MASHFWNWLSETHRKKLTLKSLLYECTLEIEMLLSCFVEEAWVILWQALGNCPGYNCRRVQERTHYDTLFN